jgi:hypothetical protein
VAGLGLHPAQRDGGGLAYGWAQPELLMALLAECPDGEGWQGEDGVAGRGLERPDGKFLAPATHARATVAIGVFCEDCGVDDDERLAELDGAGVEVQVGPFQAAQLAVAGPGRRWEDRPSSKPRARGMAGGIGWRQGILRAFDDLWREVGAEVILTPIQAPTPMSSPSAGLARCAGSAWTIS